MPIRLFNTLTKTKDDFVPLDPKNVRIYVCGPTVYDFAHIGNARPAIVFDVLFRLLRHEYGDAHVTYVRNITDVDDKINARAAERGISIRELTEDTARIYNEDVGALGCLPPTVQPRATEHIGQMIALNEKLIAAGHAYEAEGHVLFDVSSKADYGKLARRSLDEMIAGARVDVAPYKKGAMDFVLWKPSDANTPGWESPWGRGRPGWHIECSAMAGEYLGETFDIHGGGIDLMFPHHENEIAQSECGHGGKPLAKVWMHNGFLQVEGEKMSKSLGNFFTIRELLADWPGEVLRFNMLRTHYRKPIDWTLRSLEESEVNMYHWRSKAGDYMAVLQRDFPGYSPRISPEVVNALYDDLNTPKVIAELHRIENQADAMYDVKPEVYAENAGFFLSGLALLGLNSASHEPHQKADQSKKNLEAEVLGLIEARKAARAAKNFTESDRIRDELDAKGIALKDNPDGTVSWTFQSKSRSGAGSFVRSRSGASSRTKSRISSTPNEGQEDS